MGKSFYFNPQLNPNLKVSTAGRKALKFHRKLPGYQPTRLVNASGLARKLNLGQLLVKDEAWRLGLPIPDSRAAEGMRGLAGAGVISGETGAACFGGLLEILQRENSVQLKERLGLNETSRVLVISTEGVTDPANYEKLVGHLPG